MKNSMYFGLLTAIFVAPHVTPVLAAALGGVYCLLSGVYLAVELRAKE